MVKRLLPALIALPLLWGCEGDFEFCSDNTACPSGQVCNLTYNACEAPDDGLPDRVELDGEGMMGGAGGVGGQPGGAGGAGGAGGDGGLPDMQPDMMPDMTPPPTVGCTAPGWSGLTTDLTEEGWSAEQQPPISGGVTLEGGRLKVAMTGGLRRWRRQVPVAPLEAGRGRMVEVALKLSTLSTRPGAGVGVTSFGGLTLQWRSPYGPPATLTFQNKQVGLALRPDDTTLSPLARWSFPGDDEWHVLRMQLIADEVQVWLDGEVLGAIPTADIGGTSADDLPPHTAELLLSAGCPDCQIKAEVDYLRWGCEGLEDEAPCVVVDEDDPLCLDKGDLVCETPPPPSGEANQWVESSLRLTMADDDHMAVAQGAATRLVVHTAHIGQSRTLLGQLYTRRGQLISETPEIDFADTTPVLDALWHPALSRYVITWIDQGNALKAALLDENGDLSGPPVTVLRPSNLDPRSLHLQATDDGLHLIWYGPTNDAGRLGLFVVRLRGDLGFIGLDPVTDAARNPVALDNAGALSVLTQSDLTVASWRQPGGISTIWFRGDGRVLTRHDLFDQADDTPALRWEGPRLRLVWAGGGELRTMLLDPALPVPTPTLLLDPPGTVMHPAIRDLGDDLGVIWSTDDQLLYQQLTPVEAGDGWSARWAEPIPLSPTGAQSAQVQLWSWDDHGHELVWSEPLESAGQPVGHRVELRAGPFGGCP
ncbi:MAG: hypothetical protein ACE366_01940 [Bradymonadia bacterium]